MNPLKNAKHEAFAVAVAKGTSGREAYRNAGFKPKNDATADACASRLLADAKVAARVAELQKAAAEKAGVTIERVVAEIEKVAFANTGDYYRTTPDGDPYVYLAELTREQQAALSEITVEDYKEGRGEDARDVRKVRFKLHDKLAALRMLGEHLGAFKQKVEHTGKNGGPIETADMTNTEVARRVAWLLSSAIQAPVHKGKS